MPSDLPMDCRKTLSRWAANEFYVYMRPLSATLLDRRAKHTVYWVVTVEYRTMPPGRWQAEGYSLAEVIRELDQTVPKRRGGHRIDQRDHPGLNAPAEAQKRAQERRRKRAPVVSVSRPQKKKKRKKVTK